MHSKKYMHSFCVQVQINVQRETFDRENFRELVENTIFVKKNFAVCSVLPWQKNAIPQILWRKLSHKTMKFAKVFSLKNSPLYGTPFTGYNDKYCWFHLSWNFMYEHISGHILVHVHILHTEYWSSDHAHANSNQQYSMVIPKDQQCYWQLQFCTYVPSFVICCGAGPVPPVENWMALFSVKMGVSRRNLMANHLPWNCR